MITELKKYTCDFKEHWAKYLLLLLGLDIFNQFIVIPVFRYLTTYILQAGAIPFVSYQNVVTIITTHTLVFVALIVELLVLITLIYVQFTFLLLGMRNISADSDLRRTFGQVWQVFKKIRPGSLLLMAIYFIFVVPFADIIFRTSLLSKIQIPDFILDYMTRNWILLTILIAFYGMVAVLGLRLILTLPIVIFKQEKTWLAMKESWKKTGKLVWWQLLVRIALLLIITILSLAIFYVVFYAMQLFWDIFPGKLPAIMAVVNLTAIQAVSELVLAWSTIVAFLILVNLLDLPEKDQDTTNHLNKRTIFGTITFALILIIASVTTNIMYLNGTDAKAPVVVSHRGVSNKNGVQNTIPALKKTAKLNPDYVEIDLHETKDKQFIVLHDENLKELTGVDRAPSQLTLKELTSLTAREDGHQAKLASFDQYLKAAQKLHQKLLIEIKTTPNDSKKMLQNFNKKYGKMIIKNHYQVQSLDYRVVEGLHEINPKLKVLYIQPYNFTYPQSSADGYTMEYSTLNTDFIWQAHVNKNPVYAWTVNDANLMKKLMFDHADGVITDNLAAVKKAINDFKHNSTYANRILNYILVVPTHSKLEV